eukprot:6205331-Pleurochrysis_carterae.AAC.4
MASAPSSNAAVAATAGSTARSGPGPSPASEAPSNSHDTHRSNRPCSARSLPYQPARLGSSVFYGVHHDDDTKTPLPTLLDTISTQRYLSVAKDKLSVKYVGKGYASAHAHKRKLRITLQPPLSRSVGLSHTFARCPGAIRSDFPCPQRCALYYYEMTIVDAGVRGCIAFGLCDGNFPLNRPPGLEPRSYAYHGEDGRKFSDSERGESYGPGFTTGDVVGCGLLCGSREVFFTKNGTHLGVAFTAVCAGLFPTGRWRGCAWVVVVGWRWACDQGEGSSGRGREPEVKARRTLSCPRAGSWAGVILSNCLMWTSVCDSSAVHMNDGGNTRSMRGWTVRLGGQPAISLRRCPSTRRTRL